MVQWLEHPPVRRVIRVQILVVQFFQFSHVSDFSGKELEYCLCHLIEWGNILPVTRRGA